MILSDVASDARDVASAVLAPPPAPRTIYEMAHDVVLVGGPLTGSKLDPKAERAIDLWLQEISSGRRRWHLLIAPSQRGKTLCGIVIPLLHALIEQRVNYGWIMPNLDKLNQKWSGDLQPTIEAGNFRQFFPPKGPGSRGGRPAAMAVRDPVAGQRMASFYAMALGKGGSETSVASNPCARLGIDEADDAADAGQIKLAMKRTASYGAAGGGIIASTINARDGRDLHPALEIYEETTKTRLAHLCQHCREYVVPDLENFLPDRAAVSCPSCGVVWSESDRHAARNAAIYRHGNESAEVFGVTYTALDYFWEYCDPATGKTQRLMDMLASDHRSAVAARERGDMSQWNTYLRKQWCRPESQDDAEIPATNEMTQAARCSKSQHDRGTIPAGYGIVTVGCDMGKRDAWHLTLAMKSDLSWAVVDWGHRATSDPKAEPSIADRVGVMDRIHERILRVGKAHALGIDVGYTPDVVVPWAKSHGYRLIRGDQRQMSGKKDEDRNRTLPSWAEDRRQDDGNFWLFLDGKAIKGEIAKALAREPGEPGAGHLPRGQEAGDWLIRHLCSEVWDSKHSVWVKRPGRDNHLLDCLVYAYALAVIQINAPKQQPRKYGVIKSI